MKGLCIKFFLQLVCSCFLAIQGFCQLNTEKYIVTTNREKNEVLITPKNRALNWASHILPFSDFHVFLTGDNKYLIVLIDPSKSNLLIYNRERMVIWNMETGQRDSISQNTLLSFLPNSSYANQIQYNFFNKNYEIVNLKDGNPKLFYDFEKRKITGIWSVSQIKGEYQLRDIIHATDISFTPKLEHDKNVSFSAPDPISFDEEKLIAWYPQHILKKPKGKLLFRLVKVDFKAKLVSVAYEKEFPNWNIYYSSHYKIGTDYLLQQFEGVGIKVFPLIENSQPIYEIPEETWNSLEKQFGKFQCYNNGEFYFGKYDAAYYVLTVVSGTNTSNFKTYKYQTLISEVSSDFLIPGVKKGEFLRPILLEKYLHLLFSKLPNENDTTTKVADFNSSEVFENILAEIENRKAKEAKEEERQKKDEEERKRKEKSEAEEKEKQKKADSVRKEKEYVLNLKQTNPKRYELLYKAIEQNNTEAIQALVTTSIVKKYYLDDPQYNVKLKSDFLRSNFNIDIKLPMFEIGLIDDTLIIRISRLFNYKMVDGFYKDEEEDDDKTYPLWKILSTVKYFGTYAIVFNGKKIRTTLIDKFTFKDSWDEVRPSIVKVCDCFPQLDAFPNSVNLSDELAELSDVEVIKIDWHGNVSIRLTTKHGNVWIFSGQSNAYGNSESSNK